MSSFFITRNIKEDASLLNHNNNKLQQQQQQQQHCDEDYCTMTDALSRIVAAAEWSGDDEDEDEYEYEYDDDDESMVEEDHDSVMMIDDNESMQEDHRRTLVLQSSSSLKRSTYESSTAITSAATSFSSHGGNDSHNHYHHDSAASPSFLDATQESSSSSSWMVLPAPDATLHAPRCRDCPWENHLPISCSAVRAWRHELNQPRATQDVPPRLMQYFLQVFVQEFATAYRLSPAQAWTRMRWAQWNPRLAALNAHGTTMIDVGGGLRALSAIHVNEETKKKTSAVRQETTCPICLETCNDDTVTLVELGCGHGFCQSCWNQYLRINISGPAVVTLSCPQPKCKMLVTTEFVHNIMGPVADATYAGTAADMYRYLMESFVQTKPGLVCCPGPDCGQIIIKGRPNPTQMVDICGLDAVQCVSCQTQFCFQCGKAPHDMEPCCPRQVATATNANHDQTDDNKRSNDNNAKGQENTKVCPRCRALIQRVIGCRRMTCRCRHAFCWDCFADMTDGYSHNCGGDAREVEPINEQVVDLDYVMETFNRQKVSDPFYSSQAKGLLEGTKQRMEKFGKHFNPFYTHHRAQQQAENRRDVTMSEEVKVANQSLVMARRLLKYSYVQAYNKRDDQAHSGGDASLELDHCVLAGLFEMYLEQLDRHTERLSELCQQDTTVEWESLRQQVSVVHRCMNSLVDLCR